MTTVRFDSFPARNALMLALGMGVTVGTAIGFEKLGGYLPCLLCLQQRIPYYVGVPLMAVTSVLALLGCPRNVLRALFAVGGVLMLYSVYLGVFHSGVEWGWWAGPDECGVVVAPPSGGNGRGVLDAINTIVPPSCNFAPLRVLGLSFAGWNVVASSVLSFVALRAALSNR